MNNDYVSERDDSIVVTLDVNGAHQTTRSKRVQVTDAFDPNDREAAYYDRWLEPEQEC